MPTGHQWEESWQEERTPWDLGGVTPALLEWSKHQTLRGKAVLVPGCGRGHDAHFMAKRGAGVTALDISPGALAAARAEYPDSRVRWQLGDVTAMEGSHIYDMIWEYTCFCAMDPTMRETYLSNMVKVLKPGGVYQGMMFHRVPDPDNGPPFQMAPEAFEALLSRYLTVKTLDTAPTHSVKARRGAEMWFVAEKADV